MNDAAKALGNQIEELVVRTSISSSSAIVAAFLHPFQNLNRLALRGIAIQRFDFKSLTRYCPFLQDLALAIPRTNSQEPVMTDSDVDEMMVQELVALSGLERLYLEGQWSMLQDSHMVQLAAHSPRLFRVACYDLPKMTLGGMDRVHRILLTKRLRGRTPSTVKRTAPVATTGVTTSASTNDASTRAGATQSAHVLDSFNREGGAGRGLFRLTNQMSNILAKDQVWLTSFFGHDQEEH